MTWHIYRGFQTNYEINAITKCRPGEHRGVLKVFPNVSLIFNSKEMKKSYLLENEGSDNFDAGVYVKFSDIFTRNR